MQRGAPLKPSTTEGVVATHLAQQGRHRQREQRFVTEFAVHAHERVPKAHHRIYKALVVPSHMASDTTAHGLANEHGVRHTSAVLSSIRGLRCHHLVGMYWDVLISSRRAFPSLHVCIPHEALLCSECTHNTRSYQNTVHPQG